MMNEQFKFEPLPSYEKNVIEMGDAELEYYENLKAFSQADFTSKEASFEKELEVKTQKKVASITDLSLHEAIFNEHTLAGVKEGLAKHASIVDNCVAAILEAN